MPVPFLAALIAVPLGAPVAPAVAVVEPARDAASARAFLASIYRHYRKGGPGAPLGKPELLFEPVLAAAIRKDADAAEAAGDIGKMDADPFCNCQDFEAIAPSYGPVTIAGDKAEVTVGFTNFDTPVSTRFTLLWTRAGWRVFDMEYPEGGTFRAMYLPAS